MIIIDGVGVSLRILIYFLKCSIVFCFCALCLESCIFLFLLGIITVVFDGERQRYTCIFMKSRHGKFCKKKLIFLSLISLVVCTVSVYEDGISV